MVQYAIAGRTRRMMLGSTAVLDPGKARDPPRTCLPRCASAVIRLARRSMARARAGETFGALLPRFLERQRARLKPRSFEETNCHLTVHAKPLHSYPISTIDRRAIAARLAELAKASGPAASNRVRTSLSAFFSWAAREGYVERQSGRVHQQGESRTDRASACWTDVELAAIWRAAGDEPVTASIVRLLMCASGARRDEIASLRWSEVDARRRGPSRCRRRGRRTGASTSSRSRSRRVAILAAQPAPDRNGWR